MVQNVTATVKLDNKQGHKEDKHNMRIHSIWGINTVKSFIFVGLKFRGFEFNNEFFDIYLRCFLMCSQTQNHLFIQYS